MGVPWYIPTIAFTGLFALVVAGVQCWEVFQRGSRHNWTRWVASGVGVSVFVVLVTGMAHTTLVAARHVKVHQEVVEWGNRKVIGEWLRANASGPDDTVFLECLGYIGFFSQLKMYDYPGLGAPEVIAARRLTSSRIYPECWDELIEGLEPDWLVIRPLEIDVIRRNSPDLLESEYSLAKIFDVIVKPGERENFMDVWTHGDGYFEVYRRNRKPDENIDRKKFNQLLTATDWTEKESPVEEPYDSDRNTLAHAPSRMSRPLPEGAEILTAQFGIFEGAYQQSQGGTDGAGFEVWVTTADGAAKQLFDRYLDPLRVESD